MSEQDKSATCNWPQTTMYGWTHIVIMKDNWVFKQLWNDFIVTDQMNKYLVWFLFYDDDLKWESDNKHLPGTFSTNS